MRIEAPIPKENLGVSIKKWGRARMGSENNNLNFFGRGELGGDFAVTEEVGVSNITFLCSTMQFSSAIECRSAMQ